jgi:RNA polymerase sigma-70 factor, ECF subfamily
MQSICRSTPVARSPPSPLSPVPAQLDGLAPCGGVALVRGMTRRARPLRLRSMGAAPDRAEELFHEHSRRIYAYCLRQLGSPEEAEDALQATYLNACRSLLTGFKPRVAQAWLFKVAHNVCLTRQRSSWRRSRVERPHDIQSIEEFIAAPDDPGDELLGIEDALADLPEQQRRAILLREWQGLSYREVATEMGLSQGAVETLIFRARRSLAAALEPEEEPVRRSRFLGVLDGGAVLAAVKSALAGSLGTSLATGLAVSASTAVIVTTPLSNVRAPLRSAPEAAVGRQAPERPQVAPAEQHRSPAALGTTAGHRRGHGLARGHTKLKKHAHAVRKGERGDKAKRGRRPPLHSNAGVGGRGKSNSARSGHQTAPPAAGGKH